MTKALYILLGLLFITPAQAKDPLKVTYGLYASGFNVVEITGTYTLDNDAYTMDMDLKTAGLLGKLAPWSGVLQTYGVNKKTESTPLSHSFASTWKDETETRAFTFSKDGTLKSHQKTEGNGKIQDRMPPKEVYENGAIDMLTALFRAMNKPSCDGSEPVLDGKRRFDMVFNSKGIKDMIKSKYNNFEGQAEVCEIEIKPTAGKWRDKKRGWMSIQDQAKKNGELPRMWFGKVRDDMPPIPIRFQIKTNYGTMIMHLASVE